MDINSDSGCRPSMQIAEANAVDVQRASAYQDILSEDSSHPSVIPERCKRVYECVIINNSDLLSCKWLNQ